MDDFFTFLRKVTCDVSDLRLFEIISSLTSSNPMMKWKNQEAR